MPDLLCQPLFPKTCARLILQDNRVPESAIHLLGIRCLALKYGFGFPRFPWLNTSVAISGLRDPRFSPCHSDNVGRLDLYVQSFSLSFHFTQAAAKHKLPHYWTVAQKTLSHLNVQILSTDQSYILSGDIYRPSKHSSLVPFSTTIDSEGTDTDTTHQVSASIFLNLVGCPSRPGYATSLRQ